jgi:hypothetical protein
MDVRSSVIERDHSMCLVLYVEIIIALCQIAISLLTWKKYCTVAT